MTPLELSRVDEQILLALGCYRLLSRAQMERLGISGQKNLGERLKRLETANYVASVRGSAQSPSIYWLTGKAGKHFGKVFGADWVRATSSKGFGDGPHMRQRVATVDVCIALRMWAERSRSEVISLRTDFETKAGEFRRATTLEWQGIKYTPDALGEIVDARGEPWAFGIEVETGGFSERLDNFTANLPHRLEVMRERVMDYGLNRPRDGRAASRMLYVFDSPTMLDRAMTTLPDRSARVWRAVFFASLPEILDDFGGDWLQATGERRPPFVRVEATSQ